MPANQPAAPQPKEQKQKSIFDYPVRDRVQEEEVARRLEIGDQMYDLLQQEKE